MKPTKFLEELGKPIAFYPGLARLTGSIDAGVLLSQLIYWCDKGKSGDGWIYKTRDEIEEETTLSRYRQESARETLRKLKFVDERYADIPRRLYFRINGDAIDAAWDSPASRQQTDQQAGESTADKQAAEPPPIIEAENTTENTTENTSNNNAPQEDSVPNASVEEREVLSILKGIEGYKFDFAVDLKHVRNLAVDFPRVDLLRQAKKWRDYKIDKPLTKKNSARSQFRNWVDNSLRYDAAGLKSESVVVSHPSQHDILFGKS